MGKAMSIAGMVTGGLVAVAFLANLVINAPFGGYGGTVGQRRVRPLRGDARVPGLERVSRESLTRVAFSNARVPLLATKVQAVFTRKTLLAATSC